MDRSGQDAHLPLKLDVDNILRCLQRRQRLSDGARLADESCRPDATCIEAIVERFVVRDIKRHGSIVVLRPRSTASVSAPQWSVR